MFLTLELPQNNEMLLAILIFPLYLLNKAEVLMASENGKNTCMTFSISTEPADCPAPVGGRISAGRWITKCGPCMYMGQVT